MESKVNAITLRAIPFSENDAILTLFSLESGLITAKIKGVKKAGAKLKFIAQPFCFSEIVLTERQGRRTVINASVIDGFYPLCQDIEKTYAAMAVLEFVKIFAAENLENAKLFELTVTALKNMAYSDNNIKVELIDFLIKALKVSGFALSLDGCIYCGDKIENKAFFDFNQGGAVCIEHATSSSTEIYPDTFNTLRAIYNGNLTEVDDKFLSRALKLLNHYITLKSDEKLKSIEELI